MAKTLTIVGNGYEHYSTNWPTHQVALSVYGSKTDESDDAVMETYVNVSALPDILRKEVIKWMVESTSYVLPL